MSIENDFQLPTPQLELGQTELRHWEASDSESPSFVELVLMATECSEDEGEVRDLVDSLFQNERLQLRDLRDEQIPTA